MLQVERPMGAAAGGRLVAGAALLVLAACAQDGAERPAQVEVESAEAEPPDTEPAGAETARDCPVLASRDWTAWVNRMPRVAAPGEEDGAGPTLHVVGKIDLPSPGYVVSWRLGPADRAEPPGQRLILEARPPADPVAAVVTTQEAHYRGAAAYPAYRSITVVCGGTLLAEIADVADVQ